MSPVRSPAGGAGRSRSRSRGEPLHDPAAPFVVVTHEADPVVQPVGAALPELHPLRQHPVPTPHGRAGHRPVRCLFVQDPHPLGQLLPRGDDGRLHRRDRGQLGAPGPGVPERIGGGLPDPFDPAGHPHLPLHRVPGEDQRRPRIHGQLRPLGRGVAGAEHEAVLVVALHQHDPRVGGAVGVGRGHDDGVGLGQSRCDRGGEPAVELLHPGGREVLLVEPVGVVVPAHVREVVHAAMLTPAPTRRARRRSRARRRPPRLSRAHFQRLGSTATVRAVPARTCPARRGACEMADDFVPGLEGVIAFETEIAEPDKDGGALRYRGVDIEDLVGKVTFGNVWALLVDGKFGPGLPPAEPFPIPVHTGDVRVDVQAALAMLTPIWGYRPLLDIDAEEAREELARAAVMALSYVAQSARGIGIPAVPQRRIDEAATIVERFMVRWRGEPDPRHVAAVDAYWTSAAEHGMNASTFTARVIASTGADVAASLSGAIGAMSGPLHGGAPSRVLHMLDEVEKTGDAEKYVKDLLDRKERLMGFGHRVYRAEDPRARVLRRAAEELGAPRFEAALALENAALKELRERRPDRPIETNVEFWAAIVLDFAEVPSHMFTSMFTCARTAGWCAHILEQKKTGRLVRPSARYIGPDPRKPDEVEGWDTIKTKATTQVAPA